MDAEQSLEQFNPFHPAAWRWERAVELAEAGRKPGRRDDESVRAAWAYQVKKRRGPMHESIDAARHVHSNPTERRDELQARLLASESICSIAQKTGLTKDATRVYCLLFFDVRQDDRVVATDWVTLRVIGRDWYPLISSASGFTCSAPTI